MSIAHTPGPWMWDYDTLRPVNPNPDTSNVHSILDFDGGYGFVGKDNKAVLAELEADRRLMAAAPELLAALEELLEYAPCQQLGAVSSRARAAIVTAKGAA